MDMKEYLKEHCDHALIIACLVIVVIIIAVAKHYEDNTPRIIERVDKEQWLNGRQEFMICVSNYMEQSHRIMYFECKDDPVLPHYYRTNSSVLACDNNCTPVFYPGEWRCTFHQDKPSFARLGSVPVNHNGFYNWTYTWAPLLLRRGQSRFEKFATHWNQTATCGYWI